MIRLHRLQERITQISSGEEKGFNLCNRFQKSVQSVVRR